MYQQFPPPLKPPRRDENGFLEVCIFTPAAAAFLTLIVFGTLILILASGHRLTGFPRTVLLTTLLGIIIFDVFATHACLHRQSLRYRLWLRRQMRTLDRLLGIAPPPPLRFLGVTAEGDPAGLTARTVDHHLLIVGATQSGKSTAAAMLAAQDTDRSLLIIDPHAALVETMLRLNILDGVADADIFPLMSNDTHTATLNLLQPFPGESPAACAERLTEASLDLYFEGDLTQAQRHQDTLFHTLYALSVARLTLAEVVPFLTDEDFRAMLHPQFTAHPRLLRWLAHFEALSDSKKHDLTESTVNRFRPFQYDEPALMFGHPVSTLDLTAFMNRSGAILLAPLSVDKFGGKGAYLAAGLLLSTVDALLARREKGGNNPPLRVVADEFQRYATAAFDRLLTERRGFGASALLVTQGLRQLSDRRRSLILNNIGALLAFRSSAEEAALLAPELFAPDPLLVRQTRPAGDPELYAHTEAMAHYAKQLLSLPPRTAFLRLAPAAARWLRLPPLDLPPNPAARRRLDRLLARVGRPRAELMADLARRARNLAADTPEVRDDNWV